MAKYTSSAELKSKLQKELSCEKPQVKPVDDEGYTGQWITENGAHLFVRDGETIEQARLRRNKNEISISDAKVLTKSEWKRYYDILGDIKSGVVRETKTKSGKRTVILIANDSNEVKTPPRIIIDNGKYVSPKISRVMTFSDDDALFYYLQFLII